MAAPGTPIKDLLEKHKDDIDAVLVAVRKYLDEKKEDAELHEAARDYLVDEFCTLKYVLSALRKAPKTREVATENLIKTLHFRKDRKDLLKTAKESKELHSYLPTARGGVLQDEIVVVNFIGQADFHEIAKRAGDHETALAKGLMASEQFRIAVDQRSRETGRLVKLLSIVNMEGLSLMRFSNRMMIGAMGEVSRSNEIFTPQLLGKIVIVNAPSYFYMAMNLCKPFLSKATIEKVSMCGGKSKKQDISQCPYLAKYANAPAAIPDAIGGSMPTTIYGG